MDPAEMFAKIKEMVANEAKQQATAVFNDLGTQYNVGKVPTHMHNGIDSLKIPPTSVEVFQVLPATSGGVVDPAIIGNKVMTQGPTERGYGNFATVSQAVFPVYPIPVMYGNGVGVDSAFSYGDAPSGTMVFFDNGLTLSGLYIKTANGWYGFTPDTFV